MVGVPGRSKSCGTCRIRKKGGCDEKRPSCGQCIKLGLKCDGYERQLRFINFSVEPRKAGRSDKGSPQVTLQVPLARAAYAEKYLGIFWSSYLPTDKHFPAQMMMYVSGGWTNSLPQLYLNSPDIQKILLAICLSTAGRISNNRWEKEEGLRYYMESLSEMSAALANRTRGNIVTLCVMSRLYSLYETTCAVQARKRIILSNPEWKTIPWNEIPKTPKDLLIDILVEIPTFLENMDTMRACLDQEIREFQRRDLLQSCWELEKELVSWRIEVGITDPTYSLDAEHSTFSLDYLAACHIMCLYWAICIILYSSLRILSCPQVILPPQTDPRIYCGRIAKAMPLLLHPQSGAYGVHLASFPVAISLMYLNAVAGDAICEEKRIIFEAFRRSGHGETVERFLQSLRRRGAWSP
ncbi:GAL4-like Zn(II)2Cys6 (or C6 zinc) binuclear cluster DNA-binding domain protein [Histoplasma capsulatum]|uniref:GAL4-like Zn(II)2Cys6 (Or C6 zinc) binuclear cluster DNA-binding domain protein n=1 Tax=Ajellomyces capsulatus TaxID=5037 RepID=A0A8A1MAB3_AJECA|nr:GAL4-like Zn(II)2Cys6 (or C6 zinc) binuclear cluster DNA-binding domain protein [Histoplasma capsulatum]